MWYLVNQGIRYGEYSSRKVAKDACAQMNKEHFDEFEDMPYTIERSEPRKPRGKPFTSKDNPKGKPKTPKPSSILVENSLNEIQTIPIPIPIPISLDEAEAELIDCLEFKNGKNILKIVFKKQHNRSYRIQCFLNDRIEIRPVTYTGSKTATIVWELLKSNVTGELSCI